VVQDGGSLAGKDCAIVSSISASDIAVLFVAAALEFLAPASCFGEVVECRGETSPGLLGKRLRFFLLRRLLGLVIFPPANVTGQCNLFFVSWSTTIRRTPQDVCQSPIPGYGILSGLLNPDA
jgi:hypothetical protein